MDAGGAADESAYPRTVKSCGPDAPTLASSFAEATPRGDGGKKARSPGRARNKLLKPSRAGMPGDPGATVVTNSCASLHFAHEAAGATGTRHSPLPPWGSATPFVGRRSLASTRANHAAGTRRHILPSLRAQRSKPFF